MRNEITQEKRNGKREFHITQFEKNKDKSSSMWNSIRKLVNVKSSKKSTIKLMIDDDIVSDPSKIANFFNDHFSSLSNKVQQKIPIEHGSYNSYLYKKTKMENISSIQMVIHFFLRLQIPKRLVRLLISSMLKNLLDLMASQSFFLKKIQGLFLSLACKTC